MQVYSNQSFSGERALFALKDASLKNFTLINCTVESEQGFCYIDHLTLKNCQVINSDLIFEYCNDINAEITTPVISIKNPISGKMTLPEVSEFIFDDENIKKEETKITFTKES